MKLTGITQAQVDERKTEELDRREEQSLLAYLASTDWYAVRYAEIGVPVPEDVALKRDDARARISELRGLHS